MDGNTEKLPLGSTGPQAIVDIAGEVSDIKLIREKITLFVKENPISLNREDKI
ncbi:MAG: hypothetical protein F6K24_37245 [Okeania sp. SIO2D1]|nr:hypothetical protein [Okeania sp. SIO2D1]